MKKTSLVTVQGKKMMSYAERIVLSDSQHKKLVLYAMSERLAGLEELRKSIDNLAKDLHIDWSIESNENMNIICIERTTTDPIDDAEYHDLEMAATNFMSAIDKLELPKEEKEPECPSHEAHQVNCDEGETDEEKLAFVDSILEDEQLLRENFKGFKVFGGVKTLPIIGEVCTIDTDTFFEILKTYSLYMHEAKK